MQSPILSRISSLKTVYTTLFSRHRAAEATDPVQKLFLEKIREYKQKSAGGKLVDPSPAIEKELKTEMDKLERQYGGGSGVDMTSFPSFKFDDAQLDPIDEQSAKEKDAKAKDKPKK